MTRLRFLRANGVSLRALLTLFVVMSVLSCQNQPTGAPTPQAQLDPDVLQTGGDLNCVMDSPRSQIVTATAPKPLPNSSSAIRGHYTVTSTTLAVLPPDDGEPRYEKFLFSPALDRVAYILLKDGQSCVVVNGQTQGCHGSVDVLQHGFVHLPQNMIFSDDGKHLAYVARDKGRAVIAMDGKAVTRQYASITGPILAAGGALRAFTASAGDHHWFVSIDGRESEHYEAASHVVVSGDGKHLAAAVKRKDGKWRVLFDGREAGPVSDDAIQPQFVCGGTLMYQITRSTAAPKAWHLVVGDRVSASYDAGFHVQFSPKGEAVYSSRRNGKAVVAFRQREREFDELALPPSSGLSCCVFSPDGGEIAFSARTGKEWFLYIGDKQFGPYRAPIRNIVFSPDGKQWMASIDSFSARARKDLFFVNGRKEKLWRDAEEQSVPVFSPDGKRSAFWAGRVYFQAHYERWVVVDGVPGPRYGQDSDISWMEFSPDSRTFVYSADGEVGPAGKFGSAIFVEGVESELADFDSIFPLEFSPDGKTLVYGARFGRELRRVVWDLQ